jgi:hypothetical protein
VVALALALAFGCVEVVEVMGVVVVVVFVAVVQKDGEGCVVRR